MMKCPPPQGGCAPLLCPSPGPASRLAGPPCPSAHRLAADSSRAAILRPSGPPSTLMALTWCKATNRLVQIPLDDDIVEAVSVTCRTGGGDVATRSASAPFPDALSRTARVLAPPPASSWLPPAAAVVPPQDAPLTPPRDAPSTTLRRSWPPPPRDAPGPPPVLLAPPPGAPGPPRAPPHLGPPSAGPLGTCVAQALARHGCPQVGHRADLRLLLGMFWGPPRAHRGAHGRERSAPEPCHPSTACPPPPALRGPLICGAGTGNRILLANDGCRGHAGAQSWPLTSSAWSGSGRGQLPGATHVRCDSDTSPDRSGLRRRRDNGAPVSRGQGGQAESASETERGVAPLFDRGVLSDLQLDVCDRPLDPPG